MNISPWQVEVNVTLVGPDVATRQTGGSQLVAHVYLIPVNLGSDAVSSIKQVLQREHVVSRGRVQGCDYACSFYLYSQLMFYLMPLMTTHYTSLLMGSLSV